MHQYCFDGSDILFYTEKLPLTGGRAQWRAVARRKCSANLEVTNPQER